ncbi:MAG TPA: DoxX family protein [Caulobacteraceae bacterium]|nr:DoxX family protein [Caulobacteraceae bacterium]
MIPFAKPIRAAFAALDATPYDVIAVIARAATFSVFIRSGTEKLSDWSATLMLFQYEYHTPVLPPVLAAYMATTLEIGCSSLILLGLFTRGAALLLLGMTATIQLFIYPDAWPTHIQWLAFMIVLVLRGPGRLSLDALVGPRLLGPAAPVAPVGMAQAVGPTH